jgi:hypothetical protein
VIGAALPGLVYIPYGKKNQKNIQDKGYDKIPVEGDFSRGYIFFDIDKDTDGDAEKADRSVSAVQTGFSFFGRFHGIVSFLCWLCNDAKARLPFYLTY